MKKLVEFVMSAVFAGLLILAPVYLAALLLLKAMQSVLGVVRPVAMLLPDWLPAEKLLSFLLVLAVCFLIGVAVRTPAGRAARERLEKSLFSKTLAFVAGNAGSFSRQKVKSPSGDELT